MKNLLEEFKAKEIKNVWTVIGGKKGDIEREDVETAERDGR